VKYWICAGWVGALRVVHSARSSGVCLPGVNQVRLLIMLRRAPFLHRLVTGVERAGATVFVRFVA
jgi:hypothetical protein